jgi:hypothetical protein
MKNRKREICTSGSVRGRSGGRRPRRQPDQARANTLMMMLPSDVGFASRGAWEGRRSRFAPAINHVKARSAAGIARLSHARRLPWIAPLG